MNVVTPSPEWVKEAREVLGLSRAQFALMLGYYRSPRARSDGDPLRIITYKLETGRMRLDEPRRRLAEAYLLGYRPPDWEGAS